MTMLAILLLSFLQPAQAVCPLLLADRVTVTAVDETTVVTSGEVPMVAIRVVPAVGCTCISIVAVNTSFQEWVSEWGVSPGVGNYFAYVPDETSAPHLYRGTSSAIDVAEMTAAGLAWAWLLSPPDQTATRHWNYEGGIKLSSAVTLSAAVSEEVSTVLADFSSDNSVSSSLTATVDSITITAGGVSAMIPVGISNTWEWSD